MTKGMPARRTPRVPIGGEAVLAGRTRRAATLVDLSLSGCLVRCDAPLDHGAILDLTFRLGDEPFAAKVRVAECPLDGAQSEAAPVYLAGLEFVGLSARAEGRLLRFLGTRRRSADAPAE